MSDPAHRSKLKEGARVWNAWRAERPHLAPDLEGLDLSLVQRQFGREHGGPVNLSHVRLDGSNFRSATLIDADLERASLVDAQLSGARLERANLARADLTLAILHDADLADASLDGAVLFACDLSRARNVTQAQVDSADGDQETLLPPGLVVPARWLAPPVVLESTSLTQIPADARPQSGPSATYHLPKETDLYTALGVSRRATSAQIRRAYYVRAKSLHPDRRPGDRQAEEQFKIISRAMAILRDPDLRRKYDRGEIDSFGRPTPVARARRRHTPHARVVATYFGAPLVTGLVLAPVFFWALTPEPHEASALPSVGQANLETSKATAPTPSPAAPLREFYFPMDVARSNALEPRQSAKQPSVADAPTVGKALVPPSAERPSVAWKAASWSPGARRMSTRRAIVAGRLARKTYDRLRYSRQALAQKWSAPARRMPSQSMAAPRESLSGRAGLAFLRPPPPCRVTRECRDDPVSCHC